MPNEMMNVEASMAGVAIVAVISMLGFVAMFAAVAYISVGIKREDRRAGRGGPAGISRASQVARQATGFHWA
jgi:hypothetical protein